MIHHGFFISTSTVRARHAVPLQRPMPEKIQIFTDGGARGNPGPAGIGVYVRNGEGTEIKKFGAKIGETTNNVAEYRAVLKGFEIANEVGAKDLEFFVDSQLVAFQITGKYRVKTPHIKVLFDQVREKIRSFNQVTFTHVPREHEGIRVADRLVNEALDS